MAIAGRVALVPKGTYSAGTTYSRLDLVVGTDGKPYVSTEDNNIGNTPGSSSTHWKLLMDISEVFDLAWGSIGGTLSNQEDLATALAGKVDTEAGKGLSTNDYTDADKQKVQDALTSEDLSGYASENYVDDAISTAIGGALNGSY